MSINSERSTLLPSHSEQISHFSRRMPLLNDAMITAPIIGTDPSLLSSSPQITDTRMSSVRRTFCLFVLFDLILIFILWVIYTQLFGEKGYLAFEEQVEHYSFETSLFDIVLLSATRFILLLLTYALFRIGHWWMVAVCTAMTCAMLIAKIFEFEFEQRGSNNNPLSYCLIIISFVLSWLETWFLDFKVLPYEKKLQERNSGGSVRGYGSTHDGPVSRVHFPAGDDIQSVITEDNQYYSPMESPAGSDNEEEGVNYHEHSNLDTNHVKMAKHSWEVLWSYVTSPETDWRLESDVVETGGIIHSRKIKGVGKVYRLKAVIDMPPQDLFQEMMFKPESQSLWNPAIKSSKVLQVIDDHTDVIYNISAEIANGAISTRDFVSLRFWGSRDGVLMASGVAVNHPSMPVQKNYVRGTNGVGGWVYKTLPGDSSRTLFYWYMNTDIKGWFPQRLVDSNMIKVIEDFCKGLQAHVHSITRS